MSNPASTRIDHLRVASSRRTLGPTAFFVVVVATIAIGLLVYRTAAPAVSSFSETYPTVVLRVGTESDPLPAPSLGEFPRQGPRPAAAWQDGALPAGVSVFEDQYPGVANLDRALLDAIRRAATDHSIGFTINSGWRSPEYQAQLLQEAISEYGSEEEAARWVASPDRSAHVSGDAVDIGPSDAATWLAKHGDEYGLCQVYENEPWHFELRPTAIKNGCSPMYLDPTHDPRLRR